MELINDDDYNKKNCPFKSVDDLKTKEILK